MVHEIGETSSVANIKQSDGSNSRLLEEWKYYRPIWHIFDCITFWSIGSGSIAMFNVKFEYTNGNILDMDAIIVSIVGML